MSDYLRSALGYLNGAGASSVSVGQIIQFGSLKLQVNSLIAEGGSALVYAVEDVNTGKKYALKRMIAFNQETMDTIHTEIAAIKLLGNHPNIIQFVCEQHNGMEGNKGVVEYLLVTEFCPGGTLAEILRNLTVNSLSLPQICRVAYQATEAIHHMHSQSRPYIHRDIKLENFLIGSDGLIKLCDFGSITNVQLCLDKTWNAQKRAKYEDYIAKFTTPMYRAPEITDTWTNEFIGPPLDCWSLGCVLYTLVTLRHPFAGESKLAIVNGKYPPLPSDTNLSCFNELIEGCLQVSVSQRLTAAVVLEKLAGIAKLNGFDPREPAKIEIAHPKPQAPTRPAPPVQAASQVDTGSAARIPPSRPMPPTPSHHDRHQQQEQQQQKQQQQEQPSPQKQPGNQSSGLFSSLKGGAGNFFRNIKGTSSKVLQTVQQSISRTELDVSYLTSRILVMPYPVDGIESAYRANHVEDVRAFLEARHPPPTKLQFYNLSRGKPNATRLIGQHVDCSFAYASSEANGMLLSAIYPICQDIYDYLSADVHHAVVLYCNDGLRGSAVVACSLFLYAGVLRTLEESIALFTTRRRQSPQLQPSEIRIIRYMASLANQTFPHTQPLVLKSVVIQSVSLLKKARDSFRPYIEIYSNGAMVFSTKRPEYEEMNLYSMTMGSKVCLMLGEATVRGDITLVVYHARQQLGRVIGIKMTALHFHTGYVPSTNSSVTFDKNDLDDTPEAGGKFKITVNFAIGEDAAKFSRMPSPWENKIGDPNPTPDPLFASTLEMEETLENFGTENSNGNVHEEVVSDPVTEPLVDQQSTDSPEMQRSRSRRVSEDSTTAVETDLLNLGISSNESAENRPTPSPSFDIFATSPGQSDFGDSNADLLGGFGPFTQAPTPQHSTTPILVDTSDMFNVKNEDTLFGKEYLESLKKTAKTPSEDVGMTKKSNLCNFTEQKKVPPENKFQTKSGPAFSPDSNNETKIDPFSWLHDAGNEQWGCWEKTAKTPSEDVGVTKKSNLFNFTEEKKVPPENKFQTKSGPAFSSDSKNETKMTNASSLLFDSDTTHLDAWEEIMELDREIKVKRSTAQKEVPRAGSTGPGFGCNGTSKEPSGKPGGSEDAFEDLLGNSQFNFGMFKTKKHSPKTMNQMREVEAAQSMDPEQLKITEWTKDKRGNIRALLCSLHTVLWTEAKWEKCEMHMLVSPADVRKTYRKACLVVHPDKQAGTPHEHIANIIFIELNAAWSIFESSATQKNLFS